MTTAAAAAAMTVAVASPAHAALTDQALWNMDALPDMVDSAGGDNNGTTSQITMSDGFYTFNGSTSIATVPHKTNLNPGPANIKLAARLNTATPPASGESFDILRKGTSKTAGGYYKIELKGTSTGTAAVCIFKDKNRVVGRAMLKVPSQTWLTITCTKTATTVTIEVVHPTKTTKKTTTKSVGVITNTAGMYVGGKGDGTDVFSGSMDSASIAIG